MRNKLKAAGPVAIVALLLTGCGSGGEAESVPSPTPFVVNAGSIWDTEAQVELGDRSSSAALLPRGAAFIQKADPEEFTSKPSSSPSPSESKEGEQEKPEDRDSVTVPNAEYQLRYQPYDKVQEGWVAPLSRTGSPSVELSTFVTYWKGESLIVTVQSFYREPSDASSLSKSNPSHVTIAEVWSPLTGKPVSSSRFDLESGTIQVAERAGQGLVFILQSDVDKRTILYDPATGDIIEEHVEKNGSDDPAVVGVAKGKLVIGSDSGEKNQLSVAGGEKYKPIGTHRGYIVANVLGEGGQVTPDIVALDGATGEVVASTECFIATARGATIKLSDEAHDDSRLYSSPNGRYLMVGGKAVLDILEGDGFCGEETEDRKAIRFTAVDNEGYGYGSTLADGGYFRVNVSDPEDVTPVESEQPSLEQPAYVGEGGWGIYPQGDADSRAYAVPLKK